MTFEKFCNTYFDEVIGFFDTGLTDDHLIQTFYEFYMLGKKDGTKQTRKTRRVLSRRNKTTKERSKKTKATTKAG